MLHLPHKTSLRCSKCAPATQNEPEMLKALQNEAAPKVINRRRTSADLYEGAPSAAPAMQNEPEAAPSAAPATQNEPEMLQALRLLWKTRRRPK